MAVIRSVGKHARLYVGEYQLYLRAYELNIGMEITTAEATVYGEDWKSYDLIDAAGSFEVTCRLDSLVTNIGETESAGTAKRTHEIQWEQLTAALANTTKVITLIPSGGDGGVVIGKRCYFGEFKSGSTTLAMPRGDIGSISFRFMVEKQLHRGKVIDLAQFTGTTYTQTVPTVKTHSDDLAGARSGAFAVHVITKPVSANTLTVVWREDVDSAAGGEGVRYTFPTVTAPGAMYRKDLSGAVNSYFDTTASVSLSETIAYVAVGTRFA